jgi:hypothetical protein
MRPTVAEQLGGACRILEEVVGPEVAGTAAAEPLRALVKNLRMLETSWAAVLPFLHWDNAATAGLLEQGRPGLPEPLARQIEVAVALPAPDPLDVEAVQERNDVLRGLLSAVVRAGDPEQTAIVGHLLERSRRYPMRMVPDVPQQSAG